MAITTRTPAQLAVIGPLAQACLLVWQACDAIIDAGATHPDPTAARAELDAGLGGLAAALAPLPARHRQVVLDQAAVMVELSVAALEGVQLAAYAPGAGLYSRDVARSAFGAMVATVSAAVCGRLTS